MSKLTKTEIAWLRKLQSVLDECPSDRLGFYTIGDPDITVYDHKKEAQIEVIMDSGKADDFCTAVRKAGAEFDHTLRFPKCVHSTSG